MAPAKRKAARAAGGFPRSRKDQYVLRLYIAGLGSHSTRAIAKIKALCEERLAGRYELEVIDIYQRPELAKSEQIVAVPTLVRRLPLPLCRVVGDLSEGESILRGLDLRAQPDLVPNGVPLPTKPEGEGRKQKAAHSKQ